MKLFTSDYMNELIGQAKANARLRQHRNIHQDFQEPCQRLVNAIEPDSYIRPHRHLSDPRDELLVAVRGLMALITFDDDGEITGIVYLGTEHFGAEVCTVLEVSSNIWHTVIALETGCVLLEVKAGPFDPNQPKDFAPWAPAESSDDMPQYLDDLIQIADSQIDR